MSGRILLSSLVCCAARVAAQDPFEIHIYEFEPMGYGQYSLEAHLNIDAQGTGLRDGTVLSTNTRPTSSWNPRSASRKASLLDSCS